MKKSFDGILASSIEIRCSQSVDESSLSGNMRFIHHLPVCPFHPSFRSRILIQVKLLKAIISSSFFLQKQCAYDKNRSIWTIFICHLQLDISVSMGRLQGSAQSGSNMELQYIRLFHCKYG